MYVLMNYHTTCEECGERIDGVIARHVMDNNSSLLGNTLNNIADSVDAMNAKKGLENLVSERDWKKLNFSNGGSHHCCPYCGAHQSWENMLEPVKPKEISGGHVTSIIAFAVGCGIVGMLLGLFIMVFTNSAVWMAVSAAVCAVIGGLVGKWANGLTDKEDKESYPRRLEEYEQYVKEYNEFKESLKTRETRNEPEVDVSSARVSPETDELTEVRWPGLSRMM
ncbi:MAG: hypothetical protein IKF07_04540 [Eubacterium sp.]|nr:hypothetical protein [Eubacterium sp.]